MSKDNARQIEKLIKATVAQEKARGPKYFGNSPEPLVQKSAVPETIVKARDKLQPSKTTDQEGGGIKSPFTQNGDFELYEPALHTDSTGILTFVYMPLKTATFRTADVTPKEVKFIFNDVPRAT